MRNSQYKGKATYNQISSLARSAMGKDEMGYRREFLSLVELVSSLELKTQGEQ